MNLAFGFVDVRDVARAHVLAATTPKAHGRYICANEPVAMRDLVALLAGTPYAAGAKLPRLGLDCAAGDFAVRLGSYFQPKGVGSYLRTHVGRTPRFDASKAKRELGLAFRPSADTIRETLADLARWGHLPSRAEAGSRV
jgi:dihydroflavonol-4-reductase